MPLQHKKLKIWSFIHAANIKPNRTVEEFGLKVSVTKLCVQYVKEPKENKKDMVDIEVSVWLGLLWGHEKHKVVTWKG